MLHEALMSRSLGKEFDAYYHGVMSSALWYIPGLLKYHETIFRDIFSDHRVMTTELYRLKVMNSQNLADRRYPGFFTNLHKSTIVHLLESAGVELWPEFSEKELEEDWELLTPRIGPRLTRANCLYTLYKLKEAYVGRAIHE